MAASPASTPNAATVAQQRQSSFRRSGSPTSQLYVAPLFKNERTTFERLEKFVSKDYFTDCNLRGRLYEAEQAITDITHVDFGQNRATFDEATKRLSKVKEKVKEGKVLGPTWSTHWFRLVYAVPKEWSDKKVHLIWDSGCEAAVITKTGQIVQGLSDDIGRKDCPITAEIETEVYVEVACNTRFGAGNNDLINPPDPNKNFTLKSVKLAAFRDDVYQLLMDFDVLIGLCKCLPQQSPLRFETLYFANNLINEFVKDSTPISFQRLHTTALNYLQSGADEKRKFEIHAVGNCHIDTAWLWPYEETKRKCARSWSSAVALMEQFPNHATFACSQAQQLQWVKECYPDLFDKIKNQAKQGRFIPIGGCWVEMDGNMPGGESFVRQMLYGQQFFKDHFGAICTEFWLPDTFGYSAQLPQLMTLAGMRRFVTQKISWNLVNKFPHNTFLWRGIDGTSVLTHFPPGDNYCMEVTVHDAWKTIENFKDKGRSNSALMLYGRGDGGGGPDRDMVERLSRFQSVSGFPKVIPSTPAKYFETVEKNEMKNLCVWDGELYLELHNGTYTSQATVKQMNRRCEFLLRDCEFLAVIDWLLSKAAIKRQWQQEWKKILLNQFHDVLPGSSIAMVYDDARKLYNEVVTSCEAYFKDKKADANMLYMNSLGWPRFVEIDDKLYDVLPMSVSQKLLVKDFEGVEVFDTKDSIIIHNGCLSAAVNKFGHLTSVKLKSAEENVEQFEFVPTDQTQNRMVLFDDVPLYWDAWDVMDYHLETRKELIQLKQPAKVASKSKTKVVIEYELEISAKSSLKQQIILRANQPYIEFQTNVDWNESHKMLKVEFPANIRSTCATYEMQFGHVTRPTHRNTSWDAAKFEVCAQKWADFSEHDMGIALLNAGKYGHSCYDNVLTLSLLRSPKAPDAKADMGKHQFTYAIMPHYGTFQRPRSKINKNVIQCAYELNAPVRSVRPTDARFASKTFFIIDKPDVVIETVKISETTKGVVVRMYECFGGKCSVKLTSFVTLKEVYQCDLLETNIGEKLPIDKTDESVRLTFRPFQIMSLFMDFEL